MNSLFYDLVFIDSDYHNHLFIFIWTVINTVLVYLQFGQRITHWICLFLAFVLFPAIFDVLYLNGEAYTHPCFVCMPDCVRNSSVSTPIPWDLHLHFCSKMIKRNVERDSWRSMPEKRSKALSIFEWFFHIHICMYIYQLCVPLFENVKWQFFQKDIFLFKKFLIILFFIYFLYIYVYIYIYINK